MSLVEEFNKTGNWLFKHRSYVPLFLFLSVIPFIYYDKEDFFHYDRIWWGLTCLSISFLGLFVRIFTIGFTPEGTSGRNTTQQVADFLNTDGMYSIVRHPLYLGNFLMWLGIILYVSSIEFLIFSVAFFWIYYERIMFAEENFLANKYKQQFFDWAKKTPAFIPNFFKWKPTPISFSIKKVIKREYHGFMATILSFVYIHLLKNYIYNNTFSIQKEWLIVLIVGLLVYFIIRILAKATRILS